MPGFPHFSLMGQLRRLLWSFGLPHFFFLLFSLGLLFRSVFQHLYWGRSPAAAACVTLCCREGLALFPPFCFKGLKFRTILYNIGGTTLPPRRVCDTLPVAWVFPHFALKGGFKFRCKTLYGGSPGDRHVCAVVSSLGFSHPHFCFKGLLLRCVFETL